jgi:epoxide hydrolase-like predicted phosphatase
MTAGRGRSPVQGVVFDFGGVVHAFDFGRFLRRFGDRTKKSIAEMADAVAGSGLSRRYESGEIASRDFCRGITAVCGLSVSEEEFAEAFAGIFTPIEPTVGLIRKLSRSYRLGLLSNTNEWHFERHIRRLDIFPLFDAVTLSFQVGTMKPGEAIYRDLLRKIGLAPEECVFVDDLEENVAAARRLHFHAIRYTGHGPLVSYLAGLGVEPAHGT